MAAIAWGFVSWNVRFTCFLERKNLDGFFWWQTRILKNVNTWLIKRYVLPYTEDEPTAIIIWPREDRWTEREGPEIRLEDRS